MRLEMYWGNSRIPYRPVWNWNRDSKRGNPRAPLESAYKTTSQFLIHEGRGEITRGKAIGENQTRSKNGIQFQTGIEENRESPLNYNKRVVYISR